MLSLRKREKRRKKRMPMLGNITLSDHLSISSCPSAKNLMWLEVLAPTWLNTRPVWILHSFILSSLFAQIPPTLSLPQKLRLCSMYTKTFVFSRAWGTNQCLRMSLYNNIIIKLHYVSVSNTCIFYFKIYTWFIIHLWIFHLYI